MGKAWWLVRQNGNDGVKAGLWSVTLCNEDGRRMSYRVSLAVMMLPGVWKLENPPLRLTIRSMASMCVVNSSGVPQPACRIVSVLFLPAREILTFVGSIHHPNTRNLANSLDTLKKATNSPST